MLFSGYSVVIPLLLTPLANEQPWLAIRRRQVKRCGSNLVPLANLFGDLPQLTHSLETIPGLRVLYPTGRLRTSSLAFVL